MVTERLVRHAASWRDPRDTSRREPDRARCDASQTCLPRPFITYSHSHHSIRRSRTTESAAPIHQLRRRQCVRALSVSFARCGYCLFSAAVFSRSRLPIVGCGLFSAALGAAVDSRLLSIFGYSRRLWLLFGCWLAVVGWSITRYAQYSRI